MASTNSRGRHNWTWTSSNRKESNRASSTSVVTPRGSQQPPNAATTGSHKSQNSRNRGNNNNSTNHYRIQKNNAPVRPSTMETDEANDDDWGEMDPVAAAQRFGGSSSSWNDRVPQSFDPANSRGEICEEHCLRSDSYPILESMISDVMSSCNLSRDSGHSKEDEIEDSITDSSDADDSGLDEDSPLSRLTAQIYSNDLIMENIISHITNLNDRGRVELASSRMCQLSKRAPYRFTKDGDHLHLYFSTLDDYATIQFGSVVRCVPILTMEARRFDGMKSEMTIALRRILDNIGRRFGKNVLRITLGGTPPVHAARGVPDHHLILTYDFLEFLVSTFKHFRTLHITNCGFDDGAIDFLDTPAWSEAMARVTDYNLRCTWADVPAKLVHIMDAMPTTLNRFAMTRFTCGRLGHALLTKLRERNIHLQDLEIEVDEGTAVDAYTLFAFMKEASSRTQSLRITFAEAGDGSHPSKQCFIVLDRIHEIDNITELKIKIQPRDRAQFDTLIALVANLGRHRCLRSLHLNGYRDGNWIKESLVYRLADAFAEGLPACEGRLEDLSIACLPRITKSNANGFIPIKEKAYSTLWWSMAEAIPRGLKNIAFKHLRLDDKIVLRVYDKCYASVEEVTLVDIRRVGVGCVMPLLKGRFPKIRRIEAEIAIDPIVLYNLGEGAKPPMLEYGKFALKHRIDNLDHHVGMLRALFSSVFLDVESPRGPMKQIIEVHRRIPNARSPPKPACTLTQEQIRHQKLLAASAVEGGHMIGGRFRPAKKHLPYGEWE